MKKLAALALALTLLLCSCAVAAPEPVGETREFTDSAGRAVTLPAEIRSIVPSGSYAQIILSTLCPEKLVSLSSALTRTQKRYLDARLGELPVTGQFYGGGSTVNYESIAALAPDIILDIGEAKETIAADMDALQERTGIPVVFVEAGMAAMADAYETLGALLGAEEQAEACADYIREVLDDAAEKTAGLSEKRRVLYAQGEYGTEVMGAGSLHAEVLDYAGAENVARLSAVASQGGTEVSPEQILLWDPEVVILAPDSNFDEIFSDPAWAGVSAVRSGAVYEAPMGPYNWMDRPPSVQRVLAVRWLGNLLYPELFDYDMVAEAQRFYALFWHCDLSESEARELLQNSTLRS